jgi:hypothetical protein
VILSNEGGNMKPEGTAEEIDAAAIVDEAEHAKRCPAAAQKIVGWIVAAVLIFLAQRDLRKRPPQLVRGKVGVWKAVAMVPPGAVAYLLLGRRRAVPTVPLEVRISTTD